MKKMLCHALQAIFCVFILTGCATGMVANLTKHKAHFIPSGNPAVGVVYFYRESEFVGSLRCVYINVDGARVGALNNGTYFALEVAPGKIAISTEDRLGKDSTRIMEVEAGKSYYIKGGVRMGMLDADPYVMIVVPEEGRGAIQQLTYATMKAKDLK